MRFMKFENRESVCHVSLFILPLVIVMVGCFGGTHTIQSPNRELFYAEVTSPNLRAAFDDSLLKPGMPYFIIDQLFAEWKNVEERKVASVGSRQKCREKEGWGRDYEDPHIQTYMKEFKTTSGTVTIWYEYPDFYRTEVCVGDTLAVFWNDAIMISPISCMLGPRDLSITDSLANLPTDTFFCADIRHKENSRYEVSHWYELKADDPMNFHLRPTGSDLYRIEWIELNGNPVDSFKWGKQ